MDDSMFQVGLSLSLQTNFKNYLDTWLLGWDRETFLMTKAIYIGGRPAKLWTGDTVTVRFLKDGVAYGFTSEIISVQYHPFPLMFIKYPAEIETLSLRVAPRHKLKLPAKFLRASGTVITADAILIDVSEGGCGLRVPVVEGLELTSEEEYTVSFRIMDQELSLGCRIRKLDQRGNYAYFLGAQFTNISDRNKELLSLFMSFLNQHNA